MVSTKYSFYQFLLYPLNWFWPAWTEHLLAGPSHVTSGLIAGGYRPIKLVLRLGSGPLKKTNMTLPHC